MGVLLVAPQNADVGERRLQGVLQQRHHLGPEVLRQGGEDGHPVPGPGDPLDQMPRGRRAQPEGEHSGVARVLGHQVDDLVAVADVAVGEDEDLPELALDDLAVVDGLQGREDLGPAKVGIHAGDVTFGLGEAVIVVESTASLEKELVPGAEADDVEMTAGRDRVQEEAQGGLGLLHAGPAHRSGPVDQEDQLHRLLVQPETRDQGQHGRQALVLVVLLQEDDGLRVLLGLDQDDEVAVEDVGPGECVAEDGLAGVLPVPGGLLALELDLEVVTRTVDLVDLGLAEDPDVDGQRGAALVCMFVADFGDLFGLGAVVARGDVPGGDGGRDREPDRPVLDRQLRDVGQLDDRAGPGLELTELDPEDVRGGLFEQDGRILVLENKNNHFIFDVIIFAYQSDDLQHIYTYVEI